MGNQWGDSVGNSAGNRLSFRKQNSHRAGIVPFPCRLLSDSTSSQVMQDVPHDVSHNSLMLRCRLWNTTKHYVYCNKCRGGGGRNLGERKRRERLTTPLKIIAIGQVPLTRSDLFRSRCSYAWRFISIAGSDGCYHCIWFADYYW